MNNNKSLPLIMLAISIWVIASLPFVNATTPVAIPNQSTMYFDTIGMPETVDPAWLYDTASATIAMNVYDTLLAFDHESTAEFLPSLATSWQEVTPSIDAGFDHSIIFELRSGVTFSDGSALGTDDVEYSIERWLAFDRSGGPTWMIYEALWGPGNYGADHGWANDTSNPINQHVGSNSSHVWFNFGTAYSTTIFYQVMAQSWAGILDKGWAIANGLWDGNWANWLVYHDPTVSPIDDPPKMMGTGPYKLKNINYVAETYELERHVAHFGGWPADGASGYVNDVVVQTINEWSSRKLRFLSDSPAAQADLTVVPRANTPELDPDVASGKVRFRMGTPSLSLSPAIFYNFHIPNSTYVGNDSPYDGNELFSEGGTPWNFFQDANVRKGFAYAFNYAQYITDVFLGEATQPASPMIEGVGFDTLYATKNDAIKYTYNLVQAENALKLAWAGRVADDAATVGLWDTGFTMTITYNSGNTARETAGNLIKSALEGMNAKFHVSIAEVAWPDYIDDLVNWPVYKTVMPFFLLGWLADYPDPHNFFFPFYHTQGDFTFFQSWDEVAPDDFTINTSTGVETAGSDGIADNDQRIEYALVAPTYSAREAAYSNLMDTFVDDLPTIPLIQGLGRHYERTWVQGWYSNPIYPGNYYYHLWKGIDADINGDNTANVVDAGQLNVYWGPVATVTARKADISPALAADGQVNIADASYLNAHWGETVP